MLVLGKWKDPGSGKKPKPYIRHGYDIVCSLVKQGRVLGIAPGIG